MNKMKIIGIGTISKLGNEVDTIWYNLNENVEVGDVDKNKFELNIDRIKKRRMSRYSQMVVYSAMAARKDCNLVITEENTFRVGTIYTTGYGPMVSNLSFAESLESGDPDLCSPTIFASTVSNTCVGEVCVNLACRGVSTLIMGSDNLEYSNMLLNKGDADYIFTGAVEEYCEELYRYFRENNRNVNEGVVTMVVTNNDAESYYATYENCSGYSIQKYSYLSEEENESIAKDQIGKVIKNTLANNRVDAVIYTNSNEKIRNIELDIIKELGSDDVENVSNMLELFGDTLNVSYNLGVMLAAVSVKKGKLPAKMGNGKKVKTVLVLGTDVSGNYLAGILKR